LPILFPAIALFVARANFVSIDGVLTAKEQCCYVSIL
jgi:hypothetical protein